MAVPKKRKSRSRTRMKRAAWMARLKSPSTSACSHCGQPKPGHQVCPHCGWYNGRQVKQIESD